MLLEIGSSLREARQRQGLEYARVEAALRIRSRYLAALEEERFEALPGDAYAKIFLREYAEFLGLESGLLLDEYTARFEDDLAPRPVQRPSRQTPLRPWLAAGAIVLVVLAVLVLGLTANSGPPRRAASPSSSLPLQGPVNMPPTLRTPKPKPIAPSTTPVRLRAPSAWDPQGDGREHDDETSLATDGRDSTYWRTETYEDGLLKPGVGLLLDAGRAVRLRRIALTTDTPASPR